MKSSADGRQVAGRPRRRAAGSAVRRDTSEGMGVGLGPTRREPVLRFGLMFDGAVAGGAAVGRLAKVAERAGFESMWYGERAGGSNDDGATSLHPSNPLVLLAYLAGVTRRLTVATGALRLPRDPLTLARETAALAGLAPGRFLLGVGVGGIYEEIRRRGLAPDERARRTDEYIRALRRAWDLSAGQRPLAGTASGSPGAEVTKTFVPVIVGGRTEAAARRAGRLGDGFFPLATSWDGLERLVAVMRQAADKAGRDPRDIPVTCLGAPGFGEEDPVRWQQLEVARVVFAPCGWEPADWEDRLAGLAARARVEVGRQGGTAR